MPQVEIIENNTKKGRVFWGGFLIGVLFALIAVAVFWLLGVINIGQTGSTDNQSGNIADNQDSDFGNSFLTNDVVSEDNADNQDNSALNNSTDASANNSSNESESTNNSTNPADGGQAAKFYKSSVMATGVDDAANPVGQTGIFSKDDKRFYVVLTLDPGIDKGAKIEVEWLRGKNLLSQFSTTSEAGQTRVYFFQTNPGVTGEYSAKLSIDGVKVDQVQFSVQ